MLHNLPNLAHDQTLYSWCGLVHAWNGLSAIATSQELFGSSFAALMHDFPANLAALNTRTGGHLGSPRRLALNHTLLGYFLPLVHVDLAAAVLRRTREGAMPELKMKLGITASRIGGHHPLKGCPACFDEDEAATGFAYWHVPHQFPSVMVCQRHQRPLVIAWDPVTPVHRRGWLLPRGGLARHWIDIPVDGSMQMERLMRLAAFSGAFSTLPPGSIESALLAKTYQGALRGRGIATANGSLRLSALIQLTRSHYSGVETVPGFEALQAVTPDWPGLAGALTRRKPRPGHPLKHLLLISMLFESWDDFLSAYDESRTSTEPPASPAAEEPDPSRTEAFYKLVSNGKSIRCASTELGIDTSTGVKWAQRLGLQYVTRTKTFSEDKKATARKMLRAGNDAIVVCEALGLSRATIDRLLTSESDLLYAWKVARFVARRKAARRRFKQVVKQNPGLVTGQIRRLPDNCYMWLYRNDRDWLREQLPAIWRESPMNIACAARS
ncbi:TnsD family Tn7-like transposition protein [Rhodanobacter sp. MP7CTX1]|uniref:TnsD family Tn7-like transposition protein n=1 Tax=Rhodanobacter sp. MP7CTX1 TaxID=2723084 RepID=UPI00160D1E0F|nr:TnsD family Tn7-like transposition protein [Rhodanobacter sp. MP7CTX1]MBB6187560.1 transposase [Rhodanobacter sp. MP7CTX1]